MASLAADSAPPAKMGKNFTPMQWVAMLCVVCCGFSSQMVMPLWIAAVIEDLHLSAAAAGRIGSLEFLAVAAVSIVVAIRIQSFPTRPTVIAGLVLLILGNFAAGYASSEALLIAARITCGIGKGLVVAIVFSLAAGSPHPTRAFALLNVVYALFSTFFYLAVPYAVAAGGATGAFLTMAGVALAGALLMPLFPATRLHASAQKAGRWRDIPAFGFAAFVALVILWSGQNMIWTFVARIGTLDGLAVTAVGRVLSVAALLTIAGPALARLIDTRLGYSLPVVAAVALDAVAALVIGHVASPLAFSIAVPALMLLTLFITPYVMGMLSLADPEGRLAAASSAAMTAGGSLGAWFGGMALSGGGTSALSWGTAAHFLIFALVILVIGPVVGRRAGSAGPKL